MVAHDSSRVKPANHPKYPQWKYVAPLPSADLFGTVGAKDIENFLVVGDAWGQVCTKFLTPGSTVLDIGCGCGRLARFLIHVPELRYVGFDIFEPSITWCTDHLTPLSDGRFQFYLFDGVSSHYNPTGAIEPSRFRFPVYDGTMDLVVGASLFTHLQESDAAHYLSETVRVLKDRGKALFSIHDEPEPGTLFSGDEARIDIAPEYFLRMAGSVGLRCHEDIGELCGQRTFVLEKNRSMGGKVVCGQDTRATEGESGHEEHAGSFDYAAYEERCRDRQWNRELLSEYVPYFSGCRRVLDLACGPGLFLELLTEQGIAGLGVERNGVLVELVRSQGSEVVEQDVFTFLAGTVMTFDGIFCSHFLEHLPFEQVIRLIELILPRLEAGGTLVLVFPNPESMRMQLFGFWRDPEHVRFYHPELIEAVCTHYGLVVSHSNRQLTPFALSEYSPRNASEETARENAAVVLEERSVGLRERTRRWYGRLLRALRIASHNDLRLLEEQLRREQDRTFQPIAHWAEKTTWAINRMWSWPDNAVIVCQKPPVA